MFRQQTTTQTSHHMMGRLREHTSYAGILTQKEAESELKGRNLHHQKLYLTRWSESSTYKISVSTRLKNGEYNFQHHNIIFDHSVCRIQGSSRSFDDVHKMLLYHQVNPVGNDLGCIGSSFQGLQRSTSHPERASYHDPVTRHHPHAASQKSRKCKAKDDVSLGRADE